MTETRRGAVAGRRARRSRPDGQRGLPGGRRGRGPGAGRDGRRGRRPFEVADAGAEVVVDFTTPTSVMDNIRWCIDHGIHVRRRHHGFDAERLADRARLAGRRTRASACSIAPNFAIGAVLMMRFAARRGPVLRVGRDRRAAPPEQGRRAERHRPPYRRAGRRGPSRGRPRAGAGRDHARRWTAPAAPTSTACRVHSVRLRRAGRAPGGAARRRRARR